MKDIIRTAFSGVSALSLTGGLSALVSVLSLVGPEAPDPIVYFWASAVLRTSGVRTRAKGLEHLPAGNFVLAVNHQSHYDAIVLFAHIRRHMRFVAKEELRKIPLFGYALKRAGNIFVDRHGSSADRSKLHAAATAVHDEVSVVFFAEGTRSEDGVLRPFKKGAAVMAIEAQVPLVPVAIGGTHRILPKGSLHILPRPAALVVGEPIDTTGMTIEARDQLTERAHAEVARLLDEANAMVAEMG